MKNVFFIHCVASVSKNKTTHPFPLDFYENDKIYVKINNVIKYVFSFNPFKTRIEMIQTPLCLLLQCEW